MDDECAGQTAGGAAVATCVWQNVNINDNNNTTTRILLYYAGEDTVCRYRCYRVQSVCGSTGYGARVRAAVIGQQQAAALRDNEPTTTDDGDGHCRRSYSSARGRRPLFTLPLPARWTGVCAHIHTHIRVHIQAHIRTHAGTHTHTHTIRRHAVGGNPETLSAAAADGFPSSSRSAENGYGRGGGRWAPAANGAVAWTTETAPQRS